LRLAACILLCYISKFRLIYAIVRTGFLHVDVWLLHDTVCSASFVI